MRTPLPDHFFSNIANIVGSLFTAFARWPNTSARRRRMLVALAAERASISRTTLAKVEKGDPGVAMGIYATVLFSTGDNRALTDLADPKNGSVGRQLKEEHLPQRIRGARKEKRVSGER